MTTETRETHEPETRETKAPRPPRARKGLKVLVVEDDSLVGMMLEQYLADLGHKFVGRAANAAEAQDLYEKTSPDLVLLDIRLGGDIDGLELASSLQILRRCPMIVISAFSDKELIDRAAAAGVFGYLIKPASQQALQAQIEVSLRRFAETQELVAEVAQLKKDLLTRRLLDRAKSILIRRAGLTEDDAHRRLLRESQKRRIPLGELCQAIIANEQSVKPEPPR
jgi:AmiR/NasT family two-component response regulator